MDVSQICKPSFIGPRLRAGVLASQRSNTEPRQLNKIQTAQFKHNAYMDPLSVTASIAGLLTASIEVAKLFATLAAAYDYVRTVHDEIHHFRFILFSLHNYIYSNSLNIARTSMIDLDQVVTVLLGCMYTFSELEREFKRLESGRASLRRVRWAMAKSSMLDHVQRLQNHKGTISSMLLTPTRYA